MFVDDWMNLGEDDGTFGTKADNHLKVSAFVTRKQVNLLSKFLFSYFRLSVIK